MRKNIFLALVLVLGLLVGCNREVSSIRFYPEEKVTEESTTEDTTESEFEIIYTDKAGNTKVFDTWATLEEGEVTGPDCSEVNITLPEGVSMITSYVSGYDIYYATYELQTKIMHYNALTGETTEIKSFDEYYSIEIVGAIDSYLVWNIYSYSEPLYGDDGIEKYNMCQIMNLETGEIVEYASLGAGNDFLGFNVMPFAVGMDYDPITWEGTIYSYDFLNEKSEVIIDKLHDFLPYVSCEGDIIVEKLDDGSYIYEIYDSFDGELLYSFVFPTHGDNVQYTGDVFAISIREEDGSYIYAFDCKKKELYKYRYNGTFDFVCYGDRIYSKGYANSGLKVVDIGDAISDENYVKDNYLYLGYYSFGIYTYSYKQIDGIESYAFKFYQD